MFVSFQGYDPTHFQVIDQPCFDMTEPPLGRTAHSDELCHYDVIYLRLREAIPSALEIADGVGAVRNST